MQRYPKWKFHRTERAKVVQNEEEDKALGPDWAESPADFEGTVDLKEDEDPKLNDETDESDESESEAPLLPVPQESPAEEAQLEQKAEEPQQATTSPIKELDLTKLKVEELRVMAIKAGVPADQLKGLKKDELIAKIGAL